MKTLTLILLAFVFLPATSATAQSVRAQLVHNSPDPAVDTVDVYVDSVLTIDDFAFQTATPYMDLPAGTHQLSIAPSTSTGTGEALVSATVDLIEGKTYSIIAAGVLDPAQFGPNPSGASTLLTFFTADDARETAPTSSEVRWRGFQAVIDLPPIDFRADGTNVFGNLSYGEFSGFVAPPTDISMGVARRAGTTAVISSSIQDFAPSAGQAVLGMPTGLYGAPDRIAWMLVSPDGNVDFSTDITPLTRAQIVHASADPAIAVVDVWLDGGLYLNDVAFQTATPYLDVPVGIHNIVIADSSSSTLTDALTNPVRFSLSTDSAHSVVLAGVLNTAEFNANVDGRDIAFNVFVADGALEPTPNSSEFAVRQFYAVHDLGPSQWIVDSDVSHTDKRYGDFTDFVTGDATQTYSLHLRASALETSDLLTLRNNMNALAGHDVLSIVSGQFAGPSGIEVGQFFVLPDGSTIQGNDISWRHRSQIVHASADPAVDTVDVYLDGSLLINDFAFMTATPYWNLPAEEHELTITTASNAGKMETIETFLIDFEKDETYSIVVAGVTDPEQYPPNPDQRDVSLNLFITDEAVEKSTMPGEWMLRSLLVVPDMGQVDFWVDTWGIKVRTSVGFGEFSGYGHDDDTRSLVSSIRPAGSDLSDPALHSIMGSWVDFIDKSALEITTGSMRDGIESFYVAADGQVGQFKVVTEVEDARPEIPSEFAVRGNYPNPFNPSTSVTFDLPDAASVSVQIFDATGRMVTQTKEATFKAGAGHAVHVDATAWGSGLYLYKVIARARTSSWIGTGRMMLVK